MSSQYLNQAIPDRNINIRCNNAVMDGQTTSTYVNVGKALNLLDGTIRLPSLTIYTQLTSETTPVTITGAEEQFIIKTASAGTINPATTRLFNVNHSGIVAGKTMVLLARTSSIGGSPQLLNWVAYTDTGVFRLARHNLSTIAETGEEEIIFTKNVPVFVFSHEIIGTPSNPL